MNPTPESLRQEQQRLLHQMQAIDRMRRGSLSKQFFKALPGQSAERGPYFVLQGYLGGKKFSERIPAEQATQVSSEVAQFRRFQTLAEEYVTVSDQLTRLEAQGKGRKKNSSPRRLPPSSSGKRPLS